MCPREGAGLNYLLGNTIDRNKLRAGVPGLAQTHDLEQVFNLYEHELPH